MMEQWLEHAWSEAQPGPRCQTQVSLRARNSFGLAAQAQRWWPLAHWAQVPGLLASLREHTDATPCVWGGGSNVLVLGDVHQPIIHMGLRGRQIVADHDPEVIIDAAAGESWDELVDWTLAQGLGGLENLALIPGTVGAAPIQNIGAYGVELGDVLSSVLAINLRDGTRRRFDRAECALGYRDSVFKHGSGRDWMILALRLRLNRRAACRVDYGDLRAALKHLAHPTPAEVAAAVRALRRAKLPDPAVLGNAGSFFKNPLIPRAQAERLRQTYPNLPCWPVNATHTKVSAAWMIDQLGWKGHRDGDAGVHAQHALVLVNHGHATGPAIWALAQGIIASVQARFGIHLEPEPLTLGALGASSS